MKYNKDTFAMIFESVDSNGSQIRTAEPARKPEEWHISEHEEGRLAVDILENDTHIIVFSTMAGAVTDKIEVFVQNDLLTIRGERSAPVKNSTDAAYIHRECFWGQFSRTIVLPVEVRGELAKAEYKNGILYIEIPKCELGNRIQVTVVEE